MLPVGQVSDLCYLCSGLFVFGTRGMFCFGCVFGVNLSLLAWHVRQMVCNVFPIVDYSPLLYLFICPSVHSLVHPFIQYPFTEYLLCQVLGQVLGLWRPNKSWSVNDQRMCQLMEDNVSTFVWGFHVSKHFLISYDIQLSGFLSLVGFNFLTEETETSKRRSVLIFDSKLRGFSHHARLTWGTT